MKRFSFRLEKLLEVRAYAEKSAEAELSRRNGAVKLLEAELETNARATLAASRERFAKGVSADDIRAVERYTLRLTQDRIKLEKSLAAAELARDEAREAYIQASRAKELIDKLKERAQTEYYRAANLEEIKTLDDLASVSRARLASSGEP